MVVVVVVVFVVVAHCSVSGTDMDQQFSSSTLSLTFLEMKLMAIPSGFILPEVVDCCLYSFVANDDDGCCCGGGGCRSDSSSILSLRFLEMKLLKLPSDFILPEVVYCCPHSFFAMMMMMVVVVVVVVVVPLCRRSGDRKFVVHFVPGISKN